MSGPFSWPTPRRWERRWCSRRSAWSPGSASRDGPVGTRADCWSVWLRGTVLTSAFQLAHQEACPGLLPVWATTAGLVGLLLVAVLGSAYARQ